MKNALAFFLILLVACSSGPSSAMTPVSNPPVQNTTPLVTPVLQPPTQPVSMPCTVLHSPVTPSTSLTDQFEKQGHVSGPAVAPVKIIVFSDYQCPGCAYLAASLKQIRQNHPDDVQVIYLHIPRTGQDKDNLAIQAVEAADLQGRFWDMHDLLFDKLADWSALSPTDFEAWVEVQAAGLGMNPVKFKSDLNGSVVADRLAQAVQFTAGIQPFTPPLIFINSNSPYNSYVDFASLDTVVRLQVLEARQFSACPPWVIDPLKQYLATLHTAKGDIVIQLFPDKAPMAVNNFIFLARQGWFNEISFDRVLPDLMAQTGDPSGTGMGNPGYYFATETAAGLSFDSAGVVGMANAGVDTNGSQFFITYTSAHQLDGGYTIFGKVLSGMEVLTSLSSRDPQPATYLPPGDKLISVTVEEK
jgi:cyclophilin family peptidyl-prolyl cis-trans isomerase/protein-disulfide isomerase